MGACGAESPVPGEQPSSRPCWITVAFPCNWPYKTNFGQATCKRVPRLMPLQSLMSEAAQKNVQLVLTRHYACGCVFSADSLCHGSRQRGVLSTLGVPCGPLSPRATLKRVEKKCPQVSDRQRSIKLAPRLVRPQEGLVLQALDSSG